MIKIFGGLGNIFPPIKEDLTWAFFMFGVIDTVML